MRRLVRILVSAVVTLLVVSIFTFLATDVVPSNPARLALGRTATHAEIVDYNHQQGLDRPVLTRYVDWLGKFVRGNWGTSVLTRSPVRASVLPRLGRTAVIALAAMLISIPLACLVGTWLAISSGRLADLVTSLGILLVNSLPEFVIGVILLLVLGVWLNVLPVESSGVTVATGWKQIEAYLLPILTLVGVVTPYMVRMVRANVRAVLDETYVRTAVLRGVSRRRLIWRHVFPNAALPVVNVVALNLAQLIGGVVVVEVLFGFPGIGAWLVSSVEGKDIPTVQAIALVSAVVFVVLNTLADFGVVALNPRLRIHNR